MGILSTGRILFLLITCILTIINSTAQTIANELPVSNGVSELLAKYRKQAINNLQYTLKFKIEEGKSSPIFAHNTISFDLKKNEQPLQIDFKEDESHLKKILVNQKTIPITFQHEHIIIDPQFLKKGANIVSIEFIAGDLSLNRNEDYLYTLLVPDRARTVFPCFDQPDLKAIYKFSLAIPKNWKALSSAPLKDSVIHSGFKIYNYQPSDRISTYLFSFAAGKFEKISRTVGGRQMNFYHRETDTAKLRFSMDSIFRIHNMSLKFLEEYTGIKYPFKKFDFVAIPDFQYGGMEHVGAIQYRSSSLFLDAGATRDQENGRAGLIAHETAHMWFGDLVTMQWFNDVWMKEVFANFIADKVIQGKKKDKHFDLRFLIDHFPAAYGVDRTEGANPIRQPLENLQEAGSLYGNIIYHKAPIMMRQLERLMGENAFKEGLREYLATYKFGNATWPDLIKILDAKTPADLEAWNKAWVNEAGRPVFNCKMEEENRKITGFTISQQGKNESAAILPQYFEIALVYPGRIEEFTVKMDHDELVVKDMIGKPQPLFVIFNSTGQGYGLFPVHLDMQNFITDLQDPVMRASAYINLYENMISREGLRPGELLKLYENILDKESEELNLSLISRQLTDVFWRLTLPDSKPLIASELAKKLWQTMQKETVANKKKILFRAWQSIVIGEEALKQLYLIWKQEQAPPGVKLTEDDYTSIALTLAVKDYPDKDILQQQLSRIKNADRKKRFEFIIPAVSQEQSVRDAFFNSLKEEKNREKEAWVITALEYLHHPLRVQHSKKYLQESLEMLQEIQATGDIFFPYNWLQASFGSYQTSEAYNVVVTFLEKNKNYNPKLRAKILQATDPLKRAKELLYHSKDQLP